MKTMYLFIFLIIISNKGFTQDLVVTSLKCENRKNPVGIDEVKPRFSWKIIGTGFNLMQTAYSIRVATDKKFPESRTIWKSGRTESDESIFLEYKGPPLKSGQIYFWQVKIWDNKGRESGWSETGSWEMGLLSKSDWLAKWIEFEGDTIRRTPSPYLRKEFFSGKTVSKARIYVTSHGFYEIYLNGKKTGDQVLAPGWTSYHKRLQYQVYDVTGMINKGENAIGAILGDGWYRWPLDSDSTWIVNGKQLGLLMQLKITYTDGTETIIVTDESWKGTRDGAIRMNDIYNGETYDAGKNPEGWNLPGYDDKNWTNVKTAIYNMDNIVGSEGPPVRKTEEIRPVKIFRTPKGKVIADMGQNMVGWIRLKVHGEKGTVVILRHAEVLDKHGELYTANLRGAKCKITYTLSGNGEEIYEPRFTFMGFRYVEISGFPGEPAADNLTGIVVHSDMSVTGSFECSNPLINQLQHNILWGQKGNFVDVPTDCPQRDERLGWTGDAQVFCRTAAFNMDVSSFFSIWLKDLSADQRDGGEVPIVIPNIVDKYGSLTATVCAGWGDVAVIAPWTMYKVYGDKRLLETHYSGMKAWVEYIRKKAGDEYIWKGGSLFGDWLFYHPPVNNHPAPDGHTDHDFIATAFYACSASIVAAAAKELGKEEDEKFYSCLFKNIKKVFINEYVTPAGRVGTNSQTSYVLALMFDLLPDNLGEKSACFLKEDIKSRENHLSTGFLGTTYLCHVLSQYGYTDVAYDLLLQETYPSWLYPVKMGATTIWERWDGIKPDSTFQDEIMNSFNHYAYGSIGDWMYRVSAGIELKLPGYKHILIQPHPAKNLDYARATLDSPYGLISSGWEKAGERMVIKVTIPGNTNATIILPETEPESIRERGRSIKNNKDFRNIFSSSGNVSFEVGSGEYIFEYSPVNLK